MHLEILVEEPSTEAALIRLLPKILSNSASHSIHVFQGKKDLLLQLPKRLKGYHSWLPTDWRIIVLIDCDAEDCQQLKSQLEDAASGAHLATKAKPTRNGQFQVVTRLAIEELEAWFFGDVPALSRAYSRLPRTLGQRRGYRDPDAISGGTSEALARILKKAGYYRGGLPKVEVAQMVSQFMEPENNTSHSFRVFRDGLLACLP